MAEIPPAPELILAVPFEVSSDLELYIQVDEALIQAES